MTFIVGIPRCNEPIDIFAQTLAGVRASTRLPNRVVIIDNGDEPLTLANTPDHLPFLLRRYDHNIGCAGAWNRILATAAPRRTIIVNADCKVPPDAFEKILESPSPAFLCAFGFGCFRLDAEIYEKIGPFDEAFYPIYFEDADYRYRAKLAGITIEEWPFVEAARLDHETFGRALYTTGFEHGWRHADGRGYQGWTDEKLAWFTKRWEANHDRYVAKWGGEVGHETYTRPFGGEA
jgi:GT2 family glycosyltransferase